MKKMLVLALVLAVAGIANAAYVDIAVGPSYDRNITATGPINVNDEVTLGLYRTGTVGYLAGSYYVLVCETAVGSIFGGTGNQFPGSNIDGTIQADAAIFSPATGYYSGLPAGINGMGYAYFNFDEFNEGEDESAETVPQGLYFSNIKFKGVAAGIANVQVYNSTNLGQTASWTLRDTVAITVIPEPMTMVLLGLGGLFLRKRK